LKDSKQSDFTKKIIANMKETPGPLLEILHQIQKEFGYVSPDLVPVIAESLNVSRAEVHGVISFYHYFRSAPSALHRVQICRAEACQAMGSRVLEDYAKASLGIDFHQITTDGSITLEPVYCLGNCACSPSIRIDDKIYAGVNAEIFDLLVDELRIKPLKVVN
jgi:formate dehydrogenase subunit gamma